MTDVRMFDLFDVTPAPPNGAALPIRGEPVPPLVPATGPIHTLLCGEAPGRWGADKSGHPFVGDKAGQTTFRALIAAGAATWPGSPDTMAWDGTQLAAAGIFPTLHGVMLTNAYDRCPADERVTTRTKIRPPRREEMCNSANIGRLLDELAGARALGLRQVVTMGNVAGNVLAPMVADYDGVTLVRLPHPSAQGLLTCAHRLIDGAPQGGKGCSLPALAAAWEAQLTAHVRRHATP